MRSREPGHYGLAAIDGHWCWIAELGLLGCFARNDRAPERLSQKISDCDARRQRVRLLLHDFCFRAHDQTKKCRGNGRRLCDRFAGFQLDLDF